MQNLSLGALFFVGLTASCTAELPPVSLEQQVLDLSDQFLAHWNAGDAEALASLFSVDAVRVVSTHQLPSVGRESIQAAFQKGMEDFRSSDEVQLTSEVASVQDLGDGFLLADGTFQLKGADGAQLLAGKWGTLYQEDESGLKIVMESAHAAKDALPAPIDYSAIERAEVPAAISSGENVDAMQSIIDRYTGGIKATDASMIAGTFAESGIQLVSSAPQTYRGRAAIEAATKENLEAGGYAGAELTATILNQRKISEKLVIANGIWHVSMEGGLVEFGQWGNLMEIQEDGSLLMLMESAGVFTPSL
jgi:uncharacterized protein (TIGR02246 family)